MGPGYGYGIVGEDRVLAAIGLATDGGICTPLSPQGSSGEGVAERHALVDGREAAQAALPAALYGSEGVLHALTVPAPTGRGVYVILDNLSAHKSKKVKAWYEKNNVELCFTPTYCSWANPIESHFGPLREFVLNNSDHPDHTLLANRLHAYLAWRNANPLDPKILAAERKRRAEKGRRWGWPRCSRRLSAPTASF